MDPSKQAKTIVDALDKMEADGAFDGMDEDQKEVERQMIGSRMKYRGD